MTTFGWQHAKVKSIKSNPPLKDNKICSNSRLGKIRPKSKYLCAHQIANDKTIILSTENVQKIHSRPKLWGFEKRHYKISQNALMGTLFKQLPQAQIWMKFKNCCAHQIARGQTIVLSSKNVQKVHSRPKLWVFEKKLWRNLLLNEGCPL